MSGTARKVVQKALPRFRRLPTLFPNFDLRLLPLSEESAKQLETEGWCKEAVFRTRPNASKQEIRGILEGVYGLNVASVHTINYEGKKKEGRSGPYRRVDWKKAHVTFKKPE
uniref:Large ribosomal subunit protein uL23c n=1 Tax=Tetraselmis sp. GSL018 TaxID=582737 RepID=A0A061SND8_9CHLO